MIALFTVAYIHRMTLMTIIVWPWWDFTIYNKSLLHCPGPLNRPMSVPPPSAHMFSPQASSGNRPPLDNPIPAHGGLGSMNACTTGLMSPGGLTSPTMPSMSAMSAMSAANLVVPQPLKMTRPNKTYHCRMCDQVSSLTFLFIYASSLCHWL